MPDKPNEKRAAWLRGVIECATGELEGCERQCRAEGADGNWRTPWGPGFSARAEYRAKPQPKYRPFTAVEAMGHEGAYATSEATNLRSVAGLKMRVETFNTRGLTLRNTTHGAVCFVDYGEFARDWTWADDGTPCGMLVAEGE